MVTGNLLYADDDNTDSKVRNTQQVTVAPTSTRGAGTA